MTTHTINGHPVTVGSEWRTRGGKLAIVQGDDATDIPFSAPHDGVGIMWHYPNGRCFESKESECDLIAPWSEAPAQPPAPDYNDGNWHGWNGGECPVHPETVVKVILRDDTVATDQAGAVDWSNDDDKSDITDFRVVTLYVEPIALDPVMDAVGRCKVPPGQTPLDDKLNHRLLQVFNEGCSARDNGTSSPYHGHSLENCLHAAGWVQRDLRLALDAAKASPREGWAVHIYPTAREAKTAHPGGKPFRVVEVKE